jgi:hypothetical protein
MRSIRVRYEAAVALVVAAGALYVIATGWAMTSVSYDVWGLLVVLCPWLIMMTGLVLRLTRHQPYLRPVLFVGLALKVVGTVARYWVAFGAYGGLADSQNYHDFGRTLAGDIRAGAASRFSIIPSGIGTEFIQRLTGTVYTLFGSSKLAGFLWFSSLGFLGVILCIKAAHCFSSVVDVRRYALLCCVAPSLVYWPSSIGKESWMMLSLGLVVYGAARLFAGEGVLLPVLWIALGAGGAVLVRPHMAAVWCTAALVGVLWTAASGTLKGRGRGWAVVVVLIGAVALLSIARFALEFLPAAEGAESLSDQVNSVLETTTRRTAGGGSEFSPPVMSSPLDYPAAILRTITRPLPNEVSGVSTLIPAVETTGLIILGAVGVRRLMALPSLLRRSSVIVMHTLIVIASAMAYTTFSNLAILVRQRSLLIPSLLLLLSVLPRSARSVEAEDLALNGTRPAFAPRMSV